MSGAWAPGAGASGPGGSRTELIRGKGQRPRGYGEPFPVTGRPHIEDGRTTRVRVPFGLCKLLQAGGR